MPPGSPLKRRIDDGGDDATVFAAARLHAAHGLRDGLLRASGRRPRPSPTTSIRHVRSAGSHARRACRSHKELPEYARAKTGFADYLTMLMLEERLAPVLLEDGDVDGERQRKLRLLDEYNALLDKVVHGGGVEGECMFRAPARTPC